MRDWLQRRYHLAEGFLDPDQDIMPCAGTREALFHLALAAVPEWQGQGPRPAVLMPSPFYHVYAGAAAVAGAEPIFLPATPANGFLPEPELVRSGDARPARLWPMSARPPTRKGPWRRATISPAG